MKKYLFVIIGLLLLAKQAYATSATINTSGQCSPYSSNQTAINCSTGAWFWSSTTSTGILFFDYSPVPMGSVYTSVVLHLPKHVVRSGTPNVNIRRVIRDAPYGDISWLYWKQSTTSSWTTPGGLGVGSDVSSGTLFSGAINDAGDNYSLSTSEFATLRDNNQAMAIIPNESPNDWEGCYGAASCYITVDYAAPTSTPTPTPTVIPSPTPTPFPNATASAEIVPNVWTNLTINPYDGAYGPPVNDKQKYVYVDIHNDSSFTFQKYRLIMQDPTGHCVICNEGVTFSILPHHVTSFGLGLYYEDTENWKDLGIQLIAAPGQSIVETVTDTYIAGAPTQYEDFNVTQGSHATASGSLNISAPIIPTKCDSLDLLCQAKQWLWAAFTYLFIPTKMSTDRLSGLQTDAYSKLPWAYLSAVINIDWSDPPMASPGAVPDFQMPGISVPYVDVATGQKTPHYIGSASGILIPSSTWAGFHDAIIAIRNGLIILGWAGAIFAMVQYFPDL